MIDFTKSVQRHPKSHGGSVFFRGTSGVMVVPEKCPHRGASLSGGRVDDANKGCIRCPYHNRLIQGSMLETPDGIIWDESCGSGGLPPPPLPEWSDPDFKTFEYTRRVDAAPSVMLENLLDFEHVDAVHAFSLKPGTSPRVVKMFGDPHARRGYALYDYGGDFLLESEFWMPYTNVLRFKLGPRITLSLWSSLTPLGDGRSLDMHFRVSRNAYKWVPDAVVELINDFVLSEDMNIIKDIDGDFQGDVSHPADSFVALYRYFLNQGKK